MLKQILLGGALVLVTAGVASAGISDPLGPVDILGEALAAGPTPTPAVLGGFCWILGEFVGPPCYTIFCGIIPHLTGIGGVCLA